MYSPNVKGACLQKMTNKNCIVITYFGFKKKDFCLFSKSLLLKIIPRIEEEYVRNLRYFVVPYVTYILLRGSSFFKPRIHFFRYT